MTEFAGFMAVGFVVMMVLFGIIGTPVYFLDKATCHNTYEDFNPTHGLLEGCRVEHNGKRIPADKLWVELPN